MTARTFRFDPGLFQSRIRSAFEPRKPRHRLLRFVVGLIGLGVLALLVAFGVIVGAAMLAVGIVYRSLQRRGGPATRPRYARVIDAEYRVVPEPLLPR